MKNGSPNALINETSPYLLQHAYNPVQWYPWGNEALELAKKRDMPILVSIGYSACHWCHVMERESFENQETADFMNSHFINIKIDREERPDLDHIYMDAVQAISGSGGWPLNVFLTPETKPFYGGTYFPPQKAYNRPSWLDVLFSMSEYWKNKREEVEEQANGLLAHLKKSGQFSFKSNVELAQGRDFYSMEKCRLIADQVLVNADKQEGGFGRAPKFLQTASIQYLLQYAHLSGNTEYREQALLSLIRMLRGGIYDQLGGGISRYSTDNEWLLPHFEKMLYDNALFTIALCDAYQLTKDILYKDGIEATLNFVMTELYDREGGYYTALDADSEGVEGKFYVWDKEEIETILGEDAAIFCDYYNVTRHGNWEEKNILNIKEEKGILADRFGLPVERIEDLLTGCRTRLLKERNKRIAPGLDDKILLNCNSLLLTAFCRAYASLQNEAYKIAATDLGNFIENKFSDQNNGLFHTYKAGVARYPAFLDDYAFYIEGLIHLQQITGDQQYLLKARAYMEHTIALFSDEENNLFYYTGKHQDDVIVRKTEVYDGATPSANAVMANNLFYLAIVFDEKEWKERAEKMLYSLFPAIEKHPGSFGFWAGIYLRQSKGINEIAVTGKNIIVTLAEILKEFIPNLVLQSSTEEATESMPMLKNKIPAETTAIYLCRNYSCLAPFFSVNDLLNALKKD
jgi:hypothetical protein